MNVDAMFCTAAKVNVNKHLILLDISHHNYTPILQFQVEETAGINTFKIFPKCNMKESFNCITQQWIRPPLSLKGRLAIVKIEHFWSAV